MPKPDDTAPARRPAPINEPSDDWKRVPYKDPSPAPVPRDGENERGFMLFGRPPTEPIYSTTHPAPDERLRSLSGFGAPGEIEPLQFGLYPFRDLANLRVRISPLTGPGESVIREDSLDLRLVTYRYLPYPMYKTRGTCRKTPELLEKVTVTDAAAGECLRYWIRVNIPADAEPGVYQGHITVWSDAAAEALAVPVAFRVLPYRLLRDPDKQYSVFYYHPYYEAERLPQFREMAERHGAEWIEKVLRNDAAAMRAYGIDVFPTLPIEYDRATKELFIAGGEQTMAAFMAAGFSGPVPAIPWVATGRIFNEVTGKDIGSHADNVADMDVPEAFYEKLVEGLTRFDQRRADCGWPEFYYQPVDEISPRAREFGVQIYRALREAGLRSFVTKDPKAPDAPAYAPYIDAWCSQPFSATYADIQASAQQYWCYPNHNAYEIKEPEVMCRGGRMTYGFGFWRSGYHMIMPWIWRRSRGYLEKGSAGGQQVSDEGEIVPTVYWECFREGVDDLRYLYTLQTAIVQREGSPDPECRALAEEGMALLQEIWARAGGELKYLADNSFLNREFDAYRWQMARITMALLNHPATNNNASPSVIVDPAGQGTAPSASEADIISRQTARGNVESFELLGADSFDEWSVAAGLIEQQLLDPMDSVPAGLVSLRIRIDYENDDGDDGNPVGWPRILRAFGRQGMNWQFYDYLSLELWIDSDRDEVADDFSPLFLNVQAPGGKLASVDIVDRIMQRRWTRVLISMRALMEASEQGADLSAWRQVKAIQVGLREKDYPDGAEIEVRFREARLLRFKTPAVSALHAPMTVLLNRETLRISAGVMGVPVAVNCPTCERPIPLTDAESETIAELTLALSLTNRENQEPVAELEVPLRPAAVQENVLPLHNAVPGRHMLSASLKDPHGNVLSNFEREIELLADPVAEEL
ncbi:MAG: hypothetical protein K9N49_07870 [Candidatus Marinimicrobia bacterium]|nr:hypothetical protein [Candidatus Neomarinimicrobiota bacterium]